VKRRHAAGSLPEPKGRNRESFGEEGPQSVRARILIDHPHVRCPMVTRSWELNGVKRTPLSEAAPPSTVQRGHPRASVSSADFDDTNVAISPNTVLSEYQEILDVRL
jgi:hypothetical protein